MFVCLVLNSFKDTAQKGTLENGLLQDAEATSGNDSTLWTLDPPKHVLLCFGTRTTTSVQGLTNARLNCFPLVISRKTGCAFEEVGRSKGHSVISSSKLKQKGRRQSCCVYEEGDTSKAYNMMNHDPFDAAFTLSG